MGKNDVLRELARLCRESPVVALGVVGYLVATVTDEELQAVLEHAQELRSTWVPSDGHLALVQERYGPRMPH